MSQVVLQKSKMEIADLKNYYEPFLKGKAPAGSIFSAKTENCTITAYQSGKVLFQGKGCEKEAEKWGKAVITSTPGAAKQTHHLPAKISSLSVAGSDEVGTGDYFGPITVVAAYVKKEKIALLRELGVRDSKDLRDEKIIEIAKQLTQIIPYSLLTLANEKYNQLQQSGMSQAKMKAILHNQAIGHVLQKIAPEKPEAILIDQFAAKDTYYRYLYGQPSIQREHVYFSTKAESVHLAVAAASMIARYAFIRHMEKLSEEAGFTIPKGAGAQVDLACADLIRKKGSGCLAHFVKLHFANTEKAMQLLREK
ncbi:ribonuclease HIII [Bacillaceae bacterium Marseille-Q3522]|nr:ribonuclease HIII [Bacillaceae bacterium Marseille-Q3522]